MPAMENCDSQTVRVAVNIRPLVTPELLLGCTDCITVYPAEKQVQIGSHSFTFDSVFGSKGHPSSGIFDECVAPLVDALFHGYNSTVLAYGQTGSGKTYTMGTNYNGEDKSIGVIPRVIDTIFSTVETMKESAEFLIRISFIEIFKEEVFDLLDSHTSTQLKNDTPLMVKTTGLARAPIQIRETVSGGITLAGVTEAEVRTKEEMASYLLQGSLSRATASTNMNSQSSRSHAIFTISVEQRRLTHLSSGDDVADDILMAKLHLVDLAGSERAKRTGADGTRLQEGIHINKGLLSLGNVISALGDDKKRKEGGHIPYRDSKLTRILQDSLGGNSKTVMIACVSPADTNAEETLNTLKYANRARNIQNKAIVNRDPVAAQMQRMRGQIEQLQAELLYFRGDSSTPSEEIQILKQKISLLEESKKELQEKLHECRTGFEHLSQRAIDAQVERDRLLMKVESAQNGKQLDAGDAKSDEDYDMVKSYIAKIQDLEVELVQLKSSNRVRRDDYANYLALEDDGILSRTSSLVDSEMNAVEKDDEVVDVEKELEHCSLQEQLDRELKELDEKLLLKEAEMKQFSGPDTSVLKQHYEKKVQDLELEKSALQKEIEALRQNLASMSTHSGDSAQKVKEEYLQKLNLLEKQVAELKKKQDAQAQLLRQKQKSDEAAKRLHDEILRIKTQKVQLHQKIKQESEQFRMWKASREKEVLQLKKEGRRNEYEMHKLLSLNQRQKLVLQRKSEEAAAATKRLKEVLDSRKASREMHGAGSKNGPGIQALVQSIEHELEVTVRVHEVRTEYERQKEERAKIAQEIAKLKEEAIGERHNLSECQQTMSPGARSSRIYALENMLSTSSSTLISMASHLSEAEERERVFSGRGRWNQVRALGEAKNIMNFLFNLASSSRCQLRDTEVDCREKDSEIRDLKEKVVHLIRQRDLQKAELYHQENLINSLKRQAKEMKDGHVYDLRPLGHRNSIMVSSRVGFELQEEMDTSEDKDSDWVQPDEDSDFAIKKKRRNPKKRNSKEDGNIEIIEISPDSTSGLSASDGVCCSCSSKSQCKTTKCECRAKGGSCSFSCTCDSIRCSNRPEDYEKNPELNEIVGDIVKKDEVMSNDDMASHGARLLQNALSEKPISSNEDGISRRPLSDIGNNLPKPPGATNTVPRKKWRKSVLPALKVIPAPTSHEVEIAELGRISEANNNNSEPSRISEGNNNNGEIDIPPKIPRAMRSSLPPINNRLKDKNSNPTNEPESSSLGILEQQGKPKNGKENMKL